MTTVLPGDPVARTTATAVAPVSAVHHGAGRLMSGAFAAAGHYAQRAGATWLLWLRTHSDTPPHEDF